MTDIDTRISNALSIRSWKGDIYEEIPIRKKLFKRAGWCETEYPPYGLPVFIQLVGIPDKKGSLLIIPQGNSEQDTNPCYLFEGSKIDSFYNGYEKICKSPSLDHKKWEIDRKICVYSNKVDPHRWQYMKANNYSKTDNRITFFVV